MTNDMRIKAQQAKDLLNNKAFVEAMGRVRETQIDTFLSSAKNDVEMRELRGNRIAMVFQDPMTSLNPVLRIGDQIQESIIEHQGISEKIPENV